MKDTAKPGKQEVGKRLPKRIRSVPKPTWHQRLEDLKRFRKEHGHCNVPSTYSANRPLAKWVSNVRRQKQTGKIASELAGCLDRLGFTWVLRRRTVYRRDWDTMVAALTAFKSQNGHCCVPRQPAEYRSLGTWLKEVRHQKRTGLLDRGRIRQLERLGVMWEPNIEKWEVMFADLIAYRAKHGDCKVPARWPGNPQLASWVHWQRTSRKLNTITQDHVKRLDKIGFVWRGPEGAWESKYAALIEYRRVHGNCRVPILSKDHASLGKWVSRMRGYRRQGKLSAERIRRLDALGFIWHRPKGRHRRD